MNILGLSGRKQAGKDTSASYLVGWFMQNKLKMIEDFKLEDGKLVVPVLPKDSKEVKYEVVDFNLVSESAPGLLPYIARNVFPLCKPYSFADALKSVCCELFNLEYECVYGNNEQKDQPTQFTWDNLPQIYTKSSKGSYKKTVQPTSGKVTHREFLEWFGTTVCRSILSEVWVDRLVKDIRLESPRLAIVCDVRFPNEVEAVERAGGRVVRLTRDPYESTSKVESTLDDYEFQYVLNNKELSIDESNQKLLEMLKEWGWV